ncbi:MAG: class E sortase [Desertimonas sp.]
MSERPGPATRRAARATRREAYWNRPKPPHDWRFWVGGLGRVLIVTGLLMFGFVAYQLWGTGIEYAQAQNRADTEVEELFADAELATNPTAAPASAATTPATEATGPTSGPTPTSGASPSTADATTSTTSAAGPTTTVAVPPIEEGNGFAFLEIPAIDVDVVIIAGVRPNDLKKGPGHYPGTPMPGQTGNAAVAGHRTTYGQPFFRLDELVAGDEIIITTVQGRFVYLVTGSEVVPPSRGDVVLTDDFTVARLTLTTCDPKYTATNRLIVRADLDPTGGMDAQSADLDYGAGTERSDDTAPEGTIVGDVDQAEVVETPAEVEDAFAHGWFSDDAAWPHVAVWAALTAAVVVASYWVARVLRRRWVGWAVAVVPFVVTLYFFYQNVNRLLPAAL